METPSINTNSTIYNLEIKPIGLVFISLGGYFFLIFLIVFIRYLFRTKGACQNNVCECGNDQGCCQCIEACADACTCDTPTVGKCLDSCCPKRNLDCIELILCQCCNTSDKTCCSGSGGPCCTYGDCTLNCACIQPDLDSVNCLCCQIGTSNYNRTEELD